MVVAARERAVDVGTPPAPSGWTGRNRPDAMALAARRHLRSLRGAPAQQARQSIEYDRMFGGEGALGAYLRELGAWARQAEPQIASRARDLAARLQALDHDQPRPPLAAPGDAPVGDVDADEVLRDLARLAPIGARGGVKPLMRTRVREAAAARQAKDVLAAHRDIIAAWSESAAELAMEGEARLDAARRLRRLDVALRALCAGAQGGDDAQRELAVLSRLDHIAAAGDVDARRAVADRLRRAVLSVDPWAAESVAQALDEAAAVDPIPVSVTAAEARLYSRWLADHPQDPIGTDILSSRFGLDGTPREAPERTMERLGLTPASYHLRLRRALDRLGLAAA